MGKLFGTDGVRGVANENLTCELAMKIGKAGAYVLGKGKTEAPRILIGRDTRVSGTMLENALAAGICSVGAKAYCVGVAPTPAIAYLTRKGGFDAGVVVSASHNSAEFNGIKFFNNGGYKLPDETEEEIESYILDETKTMPLPTGGSVGARMDYSHKLEDYIEFALSITNVNLKGVRIALDCANGASSYTSPETFRRLGADVVVINNDPDGININRNCGSTHPEELQRTVVSEKCDYGFAFDGDADRLLAVDSDGCLIDGDVIMAICANDLKNRGRLVKNTLVATVMSNLGLFIMGEQQGINIPKTKVGDRYVLEEMLRCGYVLGGEQSGHIIFLEHNTTGDGLVSAIALAEVISRLGKPLCELKNVMRIFPQVLRNAQVAKLGDGTYQEDEEIQEIIASLEAKFAGRGRVLIRPSGTEPLVRVMIEGEDINQITQDAEYLAAKITNFYKKERRM
ncbi:MAG: phosphoglucosamine mutase [Clostridia bacterium]|nr:phosphoglucosamine mutase [Clostridia bacterium]